MADVSYSGKQITKAGQNFLCEETLKNKEKFNKTMDTLSYWRACHTTPLENGLKVVKEVVTPIEANALYAKRLKRYPSIVLKLRRFPKMSLKNMQDIGGCRVIVENEKKVTQIVRALRKRPEFKCAKGQIRQKNYLERPKRDGYRSHHIMGHFPDENGKLHTIEVQIRTNIQHYWATALEIVDLFTKQSLKTNQGEKLWSEFFYKISGQFSVMDKVHLFGRQNNSYQLKEYMTKLVKDRGLADEALTVIDLEDELGVLEKLNAFASSLKMVDQALSEIDDDLSGYVLINIDIKKSTLQYRIFAEDDSKNAEAAYTEAEKETVNRGRNMVVALVYTEHLDEIKAAYPNFFADSTEFIKLLLVIKKSKSLFKKSLFERMLDKANLGAYRG